MRTLVAALMILFVSASIGCIDASDVARAKRACFEAYNEGIERTNGRQQAAEYLDDCEIGVDYTSARLVEFISESADEPAYLRGERLIIPGSVLTDFENGIRSWCRQRSDGDEFKEDACVYGRIKFLQRVRYKYDCDYDAQNQRFCDLTPLLSR